MRKQVAYIGIGSNLGDPGENNLKAVRRIGHTPGLEITARSSLYRTEPVGIRDQPWFVNSAVEVRTILSPRELLDRLKAVEESMGRVRKERWGPRAIDLDILFYECEIINEPDLIIPHPELHRRKFVLVPLFEIASWVIHPVFGVSVRGLLERLETDETVIREK